MLKSNIKLLSIDPGLTNLGWALSDYNIKTTQINILQYGEIHCIQIANKLKDLIGKYGRSLVALNILKLEIKKIIINTNPDYIVSEDAFYNSFTPTAFKSLLLCLNCIDTILFNMYHYKENDNLHETASVLYKLAPKSIKMIMSGTGKSIKQGMTKALQEKIENNEISFSKRSKKESIQLCDTLTEHTVDAISCGYSFTRDITFKNKISENL